MTIENLKQIAIKYATTKGSRVPLAPDELCNAVVQYFNEFLKITADINTIQVAVTEEGGNIVFTITGNTLDGKAFTPIVITVDHNDFVTNQEFEGFKTSVTEQLNNKLNKITSPISNSVVYVNIEGNDTHIIYSSYPVTNTILYRDETGKTAVVKGVSGQDVANMENIADINSTLNNKLDKISSVSNSNQVYGKSAAGENLMYNLESHPNAGYILQYDSDGNIYVNKGSSEYTPANMQNIADVEAKIPDVSNLATKDEIPDVSGFIKNENSNSAKGGFQIIGPTALRLIGIDNVNGYRNLIGSNENVLHIAASQRPDIDIAGTSTEEMAYLSDITNLADVTKENTFTDVNHFTQYITTFGVEIGELAFNDDEYDVSISNATIEIFHYISGGNANSIRITDEQIWVKRYDVSDYNSFNFPNKSGTLALTSDIIKNPIYFISFYANEPSEPCHLIGTMMSKNSYGTGQKTNEEFAVMLADNLYTNSNEGLAAYGKLAKKDILCIYSEDGLTIRCLDEENSEVDLPTVMFFVMETEL